MFVRSGYVYPGIFLYDAGLDGNYRSLVGTNGNYAYYLYFSSDEVNPLDSYYRYSGFSLRCVALGG